MNGMTVHRNAFDPPTHQKQGKRRDVKDGDKTRGSRVRHLVSLAVQSQNPGVKTTLMKNLFFFNAAT